MAFRFDRERHLYLLDEMPIPPTTAVLRETGFLPDHAFTDPFYLERGGALHDAVALDLMGRLDETTVHHEIAPYLLRARYVVAMLGLEPRVVEKPLYDRVHRYGGTPDLVAFSTVLQCLVVLDWKTGGYEPGYELQLVGAYRPLLIRAASDAQIPVEPGDLYRAKLYVVTLNTEPPRLIPLKADDEQERIFLSALTVYNARKRYGVAA